MTLEETLFQNLRPNEESLLTYGFQKKKNSFVYETTLEDLPFLVQITISNQKLSGTLIDNDTKEDYVLFRAHTRNPYAAKVREAYLSLLEDIARNCFYAVPFVSNQANWLVDQILQTYGDQPDYPWKKGNTNAVFRNHENQKWYALIMRIKEDTLRNSGKEDLIEVINLKVSPSNLSNYLTKEDIFPAYHMNKKNWISVILDGSVSNQLLFQIVKESHSLTETRKKELSPTDWLLPANPNYFDVVGAFHHHKTLTWHTRKKMKVGDTVYFYYAAPYSCVILKATVISIFSDNAVTLKLVKFYDPSQFPLSELKKHGCNTVRFLTRIPLSMKAYLEANDLVE